MRLLIVFLFSCITLYAQSIIHSPLVTKMSIQAETDDAPPAPITELPLEIKSHLPYNVSIQMDLQKVTKPVYLIAAIKHTRIKLFVNGKEQSGDLSTRYPLYKIDAKQIASVNIILESTLHYNELRLELLHENELLPFLMMERIWYGIALGVILAAMIYNGAFFIFNRHPSYLYYTLFQLSIFFSLACSLRLFPVSAEEFIIYSPEEEAISTIIHTFAILFGQSFLHTKKYMPMLHKTLTLISGYYILETLSLLIRGEMFIHFYVPSSLVIILFIFAGFKRIQMGYKPAYFYFLGWFIFFIGVVFIEFTMINYDNMYILAGCFAIEALILSFAISYKMRLAELAKMRTQKTQQEQQQVMMHQSRIAMMGEMVGSIAHQWRQPLTHLSFWIMNLKSAFKHGEVDATYLEEKAKEAMTQITHMSQTIEDFQNFYAPSSTKEPFLAVDACKSALQIVEASYKHHQITLIKTLDEGICLTGYSNELAQVLVSLLENAKAVLIDRKIIDAEVTITLTSKDQKVCIEVCDNGRGIQGLGINEVFEPYKSSREKGSGMGLYIAKLIIEEHFNGKIEASNEAQGACFRVILPKH